MHLLTSGLLVALFTTRAHNGILMVSLLLLLVLRLVCACRPQATSNTLWAYAKLAYWPPQSLLAAAGAQMVADLTKSVPQVLKFAGMYAACCSKPCCRLVSHALQQAAALCTSSCLCSTIHGLTAAADANIIAPLLSGPEQHAVGICHPAPLPWRGAAGRLRSAGGPEQGVLQAPGGGQPAVVLCHARA